MSRGRNILISGAGVAGPALAILLVRGGHKVTIVERASNIRRSGQQIDISGHAVDIIKIMGVDEDIRSRTTGEQGIKFFDASNRVVAAFPVSKNTTLVREIEIMRGELVDVFYQHTKDDVEYILDDSITALSERDASVTVSFARSPDRSFDLVVAADGLGSKTRELVFGKSGAHIHGLGQIIAYMDIPLAEGDDRWSRWHNAPGGRCVLLRPRPHDGMTGVCLGKMTPDSRRLAKLAPDEQKREFTRMFADVEWEAPRILKAMQDPDMEFYAQETAQVKTEAWSKGRVVLLGDAGYCPSPVSGQGTAIALIGAYILAGCIVSSPDDLAEALKQYERQLRPFVRKAQGLPPGVPGIVNPQTAWGIRVMSTVLWIAGLVVNSGLAGIIGKVSAVFPQSDRDTLPKYAAFQSVTEKRSK